LEVRALNPEYKTVLFEELKRIAELAVLVVPQGTENLWCCGSVSWWNEKIALEERMLVQAISDRRPEYCGLTKAVNRPNSQP